MEGYGGSTSLMRNWFTELTEMSRPSAWKAREGGQSEGRRTTGFP